MRLLAGFEAREPMFAAARPLIANDRRPPTQLWPEQVFGAGSLTGMRQPWFSRADTQPLSFRGVPNAPLCLDSNRWCPASVNSSAIWGGPRPLRMRRWTRLGRLSPKIVVWKRDRRHGQWKGDTGNGKGIAASRPSTVMEDLNLLDCDETNCRLGRIERGHEVA